MKKMKEVLPLLLAVALLVGIAVTATLAWLTDASKEVKNVFTFGTVQTDLQETTTEYKMIPGWDIDKDPQANVAADSEDCFLFVEVTESDNFDNFMTYTIAEGWTLLPGSETATGGVYYRIFDSRDNTNTNVKGDYYPILKDDEVSVKEEVTEQMMEALTDATKPTLTFKSYAVQLYKDNDTQFTAEAAWAEAKPATP